MARSGRNLKGLFSAQSRTTALGGLLCLGAFWLTGCGDAGKDDSSSKGASTSKGGSSSASGGGTGAAPSDGDEFSCTDVADPSPLLPVAAGEFVMGCNEEVDDACDDDEKPMHSVSLSAFEIEATEVTQAQYTACVLAGDCVAPTCTWNCDRDDYPASCVDWQKAGAYCAWAGRRLPTEAEWEKAARGNDGAIFPWGDAAPTCDLANLGGCGDEPTPAGSLPAGASPYGALDMAGNMVELVADFYDDSYYASSPATDPTGPAAGSKHGGRGGGFKSDAGWMRSSKRDWYDPDDAAPSLGFRCAR